MNTTLFLKAGLACAIGAFLPAASCDGGDRNVNNGICPEGEVCSSDTEDGLHFVAPVIGEGLFDVGEVKTIALGGAQHVRLEESTDGERAPFELPFEAELAGAAHVESRAGNVIVLRGDAAADDTLRIVDPDDGSLFDRITVSARPLSTIGLTRSIGDFFGETPDDASVLYAPGSNAIVGLLGSERERLVDDNLQMSGAGITQIAWDRLQVGNLAPGAHTFTVTAAGGTHQLALAVAAGPDRLEVHWGGEEGELERGSHRLVCFASYLGDRYIHVRWSFETANADVTNLSLEGCISVAGRNIGPLTVRARGAGLSIEHTIAVVAPQRARPVSTAQALDELRATLAPRIVAGDDGGERAQLARQVR